MRIPPGSTTETQVLEAVERVRARLKVRHNSADRGSVLVTHADIRTVLSELDRLVAKLRRIAGSQP